MLLLTIPSLIASPPATIHEFPICDQPATHKLIQNNSLFSYDDILELVEKLEEEDLEQKYSPDELESLNYFVTLLAKQGLLPNDGDNEIILDSDIQDLLEPDPYAYKYASSFYQKGGYSIAPSLLLNEHNIILCKSHSKSKWEKLKNFIKKHKKAIIIGAAVVVAATVVICVVAATSTAAAAAAAAAGAAGAGASSPNKSENPSTSEEKTVTPEIQQQALLSEETSSTVAALAPFTLQEILDEHISIFKEVALEDSLLEIDYAPSFRGSSFEEKARELGAILAHQALDGVSELVAVFPQLVEEIKDIGSKVLFEKVLFSDMSDDFKYTPQENYEELMAIGHQTIDKIFTTDQAHRYTPEAKANDPINDYAIGFLPPPGFFNTTSLLEAGKAFDRAGFTKAGRTLMKHGYRNPTIFPKPRGTPAQINEQGQNILQSILTHPERKTIYKSTKNFGEVVDIYSPIGGARYTSAGELIGFLEP